MDPPHKAKKLIKTPLLDKKLELVFANIYIMKGHEYICESKCGLCKFKKNK